MVNWESAPIARSLITLSLSHIHLYAHVHLCECALATNWPIATWVCQKAVDIWYILGLIGHFRGLKAGHEAASIKYPFRPTLHTPTIICMCKLIALIDCCVNDLLTLWIEWGNANCKWTIGIAAGSNIIIMIVVVIDRVTHTHMHTHTFTQSIYKQTNIQTDKQRETAIRTVDGECKRQKSTLLTRTQFNIHKQINSNK